MGRIQPRKRYDCIGRDLITLVTKTHLFKYIKKNHLQKLKVFRHKNSDIFHISAKIDCGYSLEPPRRGEAVLTNTHNLCF